MVEPLVAAASVTMTAPFWAPLFAALAIVGVAAAGLVVIPDPEFPPPPPQPHSNAAENTSALIIVIPSRISDSPDLWRDEVRSFRRNHQSIAARTASIEGDGLSAQMSRDAPETLSAGAGYRLVQSPAPHGFAIHRKANCERLPRWRALLRACHGQ